MKLLDVTLTDLLFIAIAIVWLAREPARRSRIAPIKSSWQRRAARDGKISG
jgi:hypothetical protein